MEYKLNPKLILTGIQLEKMIKAHNDLLRLMYPNLDKMNHEDFSHDDQALLRAMGRLKNAWLLNPEVNSEIEQLVYEAAK